jgi:hypothetical protein
MKQFLINAFFIIILSGVAVTSEVGIQYIIEDKKNITETIYKDTIVYKILPDIDKQNFFNSCDSMKIQHPDIVYKQACLESGFFTSNIFYKNHNFLGFRIGGQYMKFTSWIECLQYYRDWQSRHYKGGDYYQFLEQSGYFEDKEYINKLKHIKI